MNEAHNLNMPHFSNGIQMNKDIRPKTLFFALLKDEPDPAKRLVVLDRPKDFNPNIHEKYVAPAQPELEVLEQPKPVTVKIARSRAKAKKVEEPKEEVEPVTEQNEEETATEPQSDTGSDL